MIEEYGDPQFTGIERELTSAVGQCLYVTAQWLLLWTSLLGRKPEKPFKLQKLSDAENNLNQILYGMPDEMRQRVLHHALEISLRNVAALMPHTFKPSTAEANEE